jgi:hypothetical protein
MPPSLQFYFTTIAGSMNFFATKLLWSGCAARLPSAIRVSAETPRVSSDVHARRIDAVGQHVAMEDIPP